jgi:hypothetical protein
MGEFLSARVHLETAIALYDPVRQGSRVLNGLGADTGVFTMCAAATTLWQLGYPDQALDLGTEALTLAQRMSHPYSLALAEFFVALLPQNRRETGAVQELAEGLSALCAEHGLLELCHLPTVFADGRWPISAPPFSVQVESVHEWAKDGGVSSGCY